MMSMDEAIRALRADPLQRQLVEDAYLGPNVVESARRFSDSEEFQEVKELIGKTLMGGVVLDVGSGTGLSSWAFARNGAKLVYALEPDASDEVGRGAMAKIRHDKLPIFGLGAVGESIPIENERCDIVYTRQVLHHIRDLELALRECSRVLKPGGLFVATREHVVDNEEQLSYFLAHHPLHALVGGEHAYSLDKYLAAIRLAGLRVLRVLGPWDSVINAYPGARTREELQQMPNRRLEERFGVAGEILIRLPGVRHLVWLRLKRSIPGRMYSFIAEKSR